MTDYNEFNWNEEAPGTQVPAPAPAPVYTENILRPKKKGGRAKLVVGVICGALVGSLLSTTLVLSLGPALGVGGSSVSEVHFFKATGDRSSVDKPTVTQVNVESGTERTTTEIAQEVGPAVVGISGTVSYQNYFFGGTQTGISSGSGIVISPEGHIITNYHVIEGASDIKVKFSTGDEYDATVIGGDEQMDVAVLQIPPFDNMPIASVGDSDLVEVGDRAIAIGNPLGDELFGTVTQGVISGKNRTVVVDNREMTLLQTDAAINPGNSGGALIDAYGHVIGINSVKISGSSSGSSSEGLGFAIPINEVMSVAEDLITYGYVTGRPLIGVNVQPITAAIAYYLPVDHGLYVMGVTEGGAADKAGVQRGDIILNFDGVEVNTNADLNAQRDKHKAGDTVKMEIDRGGERMTIEITLDEDQSAKSN